MTRYVEAVVMVIYPVIIFSLIIVAWKGYVTPTNSFMACNQVIALNWNWIECDLLKLSTVRHRPREVSSMCCHRPRDVALLIYWRQHVVLGELCGKKYSQSSNRSKFNVFSRISLVSVANECALNSHWLLSCYCCTIVVISLRLQTFCCQYKAILSWNFVIWSGFLGPLSHRLRE